MVRETLHGAGRPAVDAASGAHRHGGEASCPGGGLARGARALQARPVRFRGRSVLLALAALAGCAEPPPDATPEGAIRAFVAAMERSEYDGDARADAFALLDPASRQELERRARRASNLARRELAPWEMIAPGTFRLRVPLRELEARVEDGAGVVVVRGAGREVEVPVVSEPLEDGGERWRVVLFQELPAAR
ncbi:MAG: hypothetical protein CMN29_16595 [Sandaracinus sp.]|nr:hypothetical protein [Sandaracinus sp.]